MSSLRKELTWLAVYGTLAGVGGVIGFAPIFPSLAEEAALAPVPDPRPSSAPKPIELVAGRADHGEAAFSKVCISCHTIGGGPRVGPDLAGVPQKRDPKWLRAWLKDPMGMQASDPLAKQLVAEWKGIPMPPTGFDDQTVEDVIAYLASKGP